MYLSAPGCFKVFSIFISLYFLKELKMYALYDPWLGIFIFLKASIPCRAGDTVTSVGYFPWFMS